MRLTDDFEDNGNQTGLPVAFMAVGVMSFMLLVVIVVMAVNHKPRRHAADQASQAQQQALTEDTQTAQQDDNFGIGDSTLTSDQLDFWDMYKEDNEPRHGSEPTVSASSYEQKAQQILEEEQQQEPDLSEGGIKTKVDLPDGGEQWVMINAYIPKHNYDFVGLVYQEPVMRYYENGTNISHLGIHLNKSSGKVNFSRLKSAGVEYAIIRVGMRGYQNGQLSIDDSFETYLEEAQKAGLQVGLSFYSQAVTEEEAAEEANLLLECIGERQITYPIVFDMELVTNDTSRVQLQSKIVLTGIADAFCRTIRDAGYTPMIYGNKYWLLRRIDLTKLGDYDIWLSQEADVPDYPYKFAMWEYTREGEIQGVDGDAALSISFIDYTMR
ncbi:MAG: hypothetical protein IJ711_07580 [Lachnospiraceae bacterium]|nr:hypothetical protein [Lachnospiraceae bacterium]